MKPQELRVGNYIGHREYGELYCETVAWFDADEIHTDEGNDYDWGDVEPVPLTEDWLRDFGFEWKKDNQWWIPSKGNSFRPELRMIYNETDFYFMVSAFYEIRIEHIHQLQNLYFALTGKGL